MAPRGAGARDRRNQVRQTERADLRARVEFLEAVLKDCWRWSTFDGKDVDALRDVLARADAEHELNEALDGLERGQI